MTKLCTLLLLALFAALVSCGPADNGQAKRASAPNSAEGELLLEADLIIGRMEVMLDQSIHGLQVLGARVRAEDSDLPSLPTADAPRDLRLRTLVQRHNVLSTKACSSGIWPAGGCTFTPFAPAWLQASGAASAQTIKSMADEAQAHVMILWDGVCAKAKAKSGDEHFCAIE